MEDCSRPTVRQVMARGRQCMTFHDLKLQLETLTCTRLHKVSNNFPTLDGSNFNKHETGIPSNTPTGV